MPTHHVDLEGLSLHPGRPVQLAGSPFNVLTPTRIYELVEDTSTAGLPCLWIALGLTSADWALADMGDVGIVQPSTLPNLISDTGGASVFRLGITYPGLFTSGEASLGTLYNFQTGIEDDDIASPIVGRDRLTTYAEATSDDQVNPGNLIAIVPYFRVPFGFTGWAADALTLYSRLTAHTFGVPEVISLRIELMDPLTFLPFGSPLVKTRAMTIGEDYEPLTFTAADMAANYAADDVIKAAISVTVAPTGMAGLATFRLGRLDGPNWRGV